MFHLEHAIAEWRQQMLGAGIKPVRELEELEAHLLEEMHQQLQSGIDPQRAFEAAVQQIGQAAELSAEFRKIVRTNEARRWKLVGIAYSSGAFWFSMLPIYSWLTVPKLGAAFSATDRMLVFTALAATLLSVPGWRYGRRFLPVISNQRVRAAIGTAGCVSGVGGMILIWLLIVPVLGLMRAQTFTILITWAWTAMAILGGAGYGLAIAASPKSQRQSSKPCAWIDDLE